MAYKRHQDNLDYQRTYRKTHPVKKYNDKSAERRKKWDRMHNALLKKDVFSVYSDGTVSCAFCGINDLDVLCIDHIKDGGREHRRSIGNKGGNAFYRWLKRNNYPSGFQVLCANCNTKKQVMKYREADEN